MQHKAMGNLRLIAHQLVDGAGGIGQVKATKYQSEALVPGKQRCLAACLSPCSRFIAHI
jgi:hypothetical protein